MLQLRQVVSIWGMVAAFSSWKPSDIRTSQLVILYVIIKTLKIGNYRSRFVLKMLEHDDNKSQWKKVLFSTLIVTYYF